MPSKPYSWRSVGASFSPSLAPPPSLSGTYTWNRLKVGVGGFVTGFSAHSDGTLVLRCDTLGAYIYNRSAPSDGNAGGTGQWQQLLTTQRIPAGFYGSPFSGSGAYDIQIAPGNSAVIYMAAGTVAGNGGDMYVSTNRGGSFVRSTGAITGAMASNGGPGGSGAFGGFPFESRLFPNKIAVDPADTTGNCAIVATQNGGTWETTNGLAGASVTWTQLSGVPACDGNNMGSVAFDPNSGTSVVAGLTRTNRVYVAASGSGLYRRDTPTGSFSSVSLTGGPQINFTNMYVDPAGILLVVDWGNDFFTYTVSGASGTWAQPNPWPFNSGETTVYIAPHPTTAGDIIFSSAGGGWSQTNNYCSSMFSYNDLNQASYDATDIPWLMTSWNMRILKNPTLGPPLRDPSNTSVMWVPGAQAVMTTAVPVPTDGGAIASTNVTIPSASSLPTTISGIGVGSVVNSSPFVVGDAFCGLDGGQTNGISGIVTGITGGAGAGGTITVNVLNAKGSGTISGMQFQRVNHYVSRGTGIEQLVGNHVLFPPGGSLLTCSWDEGLIRAPSLSAYPLSQGWDTTNLISMCIDADYASSNSSFIAACMGAPQVGDNDAFSNDGGQTFALFTNQANTAAGNSAIGCIACGTPTSIVRLIQGDNTGVHSGMFFTTNGGASAWTKSNPTNVTNYGAAFFANRRVLCADRVVNPSNAALTPYNFYTTSSPNDTGATSTSGIYVSRDGGSSWTLTQANNGAAGQIDFGQNAILKSVPGHAGHLFFSTGLFGGTTHPQSTYLFWRSTDGLNSPGPTLQSVDNANYQIREVQAFGFGGVAPNQSYPSICVWGYVNALGAGYVLGFWESIDNCATWQMIGGPYPPRANDGGASWIDLPSDITGDPNNYGKWYVSLAGGYMYASK